MLIIYLIISIILFVVFYLILWRYIFFFRNPKRVISYDPKIILSPADGFVIYCKRISPNQDIFSIKKKTNIKLNDLMYIDDKNLLNQPGWLIGIFMTFINVHYNRAPIGGIIKKIKHEFPKKLKVNRGMMRVYKNMIFCRKQLWKDCDYIITNERASFIIQNENMSVYITQIADRYINKIVTYKNNETIKQGEIFGLIKMGSQVDLFIPDKNGHFELLIKEKQRVKAGLTKLLQINNNKIKE